MPRCPPRINPSTKQNEMAIYAQCSDLASRDLRWAPRHPGTDAPFNLITPPSGISAPVLAAQYSETFHSEAIAALPTFED